ncbi:hypothetical protein LLEC1_04098 [Akanthomyces lecanii]|uniref:Uncharacterized protein n=1 Tax=Cordyceps confragosa TaxID=2714763 RepID=A0A179I7R6_CORDF|nr:hypothetical protein LLEC1_04098 [Akanthomyces lecanii]
MAGTNRDDLDGRPSGSRFVIFNSEQPTKTAILTGLAFLCFLLVVRFGLQRGVAWVRQSRSRRFSYTQERTLPASPIPDEKMPQPSSCHNRPDFQRERSSADDSDDSASFSVPSAVPARQQRRLLTRLPPPPPLTPPELSAAIFACNEDVDGFISQPNPDYMSATSSTPFEDAQHTPRRRSYLKTMTIGTPMLASADDAFAVPRFGPGSYPPSPVRGHEDDAPRRSVDVKGEIISVVNQDGEGWTRHTRVYGGGACLACAASGGQEGGFYGATVTPEEMRY